MLEEGGGRLRRGGEVVLHLGEAGVELVGGEVLAVAEGFIADLDSERDDGDAQLFDEGAGDVAGAVGDDVYGHYSTPIR